MIANAYETYEKFHSPEIITEELFKYYQHVLDGEYDFSDIKIEDTKREFSEIIEHYNDRYDYFTKPKSVRLRLWYIYHIKYAIVAKEILDVFFPDLRLNGFIDTYKEGRYCGLEIFQPDDLLRDNQNIVFVGIEKAQEEVIQVLEKHSRECNKNYFLLAPRRW